MGTRGAIAKPPEEWQKILAQREADYAEARKTGNPKVYRELRWKLKYARDKVAAAGLEPLPPGSVAPSNPLDGKIRDSVPQPEINFGELWKAAAEVKPFIDDLLARAGKMSGKNFKASELTGRVLGMGFILIQRRRIPPALMQNADLVLLGIGGGILILENLEQFSKTKPTQDPGAIDPVKNPVDGNGTKAG